MSGKKLQTTGRCTDNTCCAAPPEQPQICNCLGLLIEGVANINCAVCANCPRMNGFKFVAGGSPISGPAWEGSLCHPSGYFYEVCYVDRVIVSIEFASGLWWIRIRLKRIPTAPLPPSPPAPSGGSPTTYSTPAWQKSYTEFPLCQNFVLEEIPYNPSFNSVSCDFSGSTAKLTYFGGTCVNLHDCQNLPTPDPCPVCIDGIAPTNYLVEIPGNFNSTGNAFLKCDGAVGSFLTTRQPFFEHQCRWLYGPLTPGKPFNDPNCTPVRIEALWENNGFSFTGWFQVGIYWACGARATGGTCDCGGITWRINLADVCPFKADCLFGGSPLSIPFSSQNWHTPFADGCNNCSNTGSCNWDGSDITVTAIV